jgi:hypothetical protein
VLKCHRYGWNLGNKGSGLLELTGPDQQVERQPKFSQTPIARLPRRIVE